MLYEGLTGQIIGSAIEVHREIGPGLLESTYQACLAKEFALRDILFEQEKPLAVKYKGLHVDCGYRLDFLIDGKVIVELKSVSVLQPVHEAQLLTYLKLADCRVGLLINFNVPKLKAGIKRMVLERTSPSYGVTKIFSVLSVFSVVKSLLFKQTRGIEI